MVQTRVEALQHTLVAQAATEQQVRDGGRKRFQQSEQKKIKRQDRQTSDFERKISPKNITSVRAE